MRWTMFMKGYPQIRTATEKHGLHIRFRVDILEQCIDGRLREKSNAPITSHYDEVHPKGFKPVVPSILI